MKKVFRLLVLLMAMSPIGSAHCAPNGPTPIISALFGSPEALSTAGSQKSEAENAKANVRKIAWDICQIYHGNWNRMQWSLDAGSYCAKLPGMFGSMTENLFWASSFPFGLTGQGVMSGMPLGNSENWPDDQLKTNIPANAPYMMKQLDRLHEYRDIIMDCAKKFDVPWYIIAGICSRESHCGLKLIDGKGDHGYGHGLMQIDVRWHAEHIESGDWLDPQKHFEYACNFLREECISPFLTGYGLDELGILRAGIAAYNRGTETIKEALSNGYDIDYHTANQNYSADVLNRAGWFQQYGGFENAIESGNNETQVKSPKTNTSPDFNFRLKTSIVADDPQMLAQLKEFRKYEEIVRHYAYRYELPWYIVAGICSRESQWGLGLSPKGPAGTSTNGTIFGLMQISQKWHPEHIKSGDYMHPQRHFEYACRFLSQECFKPFLTGYGLDELDILRAGITAYKLGTKRVKETLSNGYDNDLFSTDQNYSTDVLNRAGWFQQFARLTN